jgi:putative glutamine amidotransferase
MTSKPLIGINADFRSNHQQTPAYSFVAAGYYRAIQAAGGIPLIMPPTADLESVQQILDVVHGVLLIGGADLDPHLDGCHRHSSTKLMDPVRERFDRMLIGEIAERRVPVFGIGAGMQLINVQQGGTLFLHLPEDLPTAIPHRDMIDAQHRHALSVVADSLVGRVYGDGEIRVTSRHHMAIDDLAPGFRVTARCPDQVIEAIESEMLDWFAIGTQFHPESDAASAVDIRLFEEFVDGVKLRQNNALRLVA